MNLKCWNCGERMDEVPGEIPIFKDGVIITKEQVNINKCSECGEVSFPLVLVKELHAKHGLKI